MLKKQIIIEKHDNLAQADTSEKKIDKTMTKFLVNMKKQESDWNENLIDQENENIEISDENQIKISLDKEFEKNNNDEES